MTTEKKNGNGNGGALSAEELAKLEREAIEALDPKDRLALLWQRQSLDLHREQVGILRAQQRAVELAEPAAAERVRQAGERAEEIAQGRREWSALVDVTHELANVQGSPHVVVRCRLAGHVRGATEEGAGTHFVREATLVDFSQAEEIIRADVLKPHADVLAAYERAADEVAIATMKKNLFGKGRADGFMHRFWTEVRKPLLHKLVGKGPLEDLVKRGACVVVGDVEVDPTPCRTSMEPT